MFWQVVKKEKILQHAQESNNEENDTSVESVATFSEQLVFDDDSQSDADDPVDECSAAVITDVPPKAINLLKLDDWREDNLQVLEEISHNKKLVTATLPGPVSRFRKLVVSVFRRQATAGNKNDSYDVFSEIDF
jgi:hypothetical protein